MTEINMLDRIRENFTESIQTKILSADTILDEINIAAKKIVKCLLDDYKIMSCGNGGSACDALHFSSEMVNRFRCERPGLPALALTADVATLTSIANDYAYENIFARQIRALGHAGDILLAISTSGNSANVINAINAAHEKKISVIALTGGTGGKLTAHLLPTDTEIRIPSDVTARIQEIHLLIIHSICDVVETSLFGITEAETKTYE